MQNWLKRQKRSSNAATCLKLFALKPFMNLVRPLLPSFTDVSGALFSSCHQVFECRVRLTAPVSRERNPSPFSFLINLGEKEYLVGASPEMFVRSKGSRIETCPISGTIARGKTAIEDAQNIKELLNSIKVCILTASPCAPSELVSMSHYSQFVLVSNALLRFVGRK